MLIFDLVLATRRPEMTGVERYGVKLFEAMRKLRSDTLAIARDTTAFTDPSGVLTVPSVHGGWARLPLDIRRRRLETTAVIFPTAPASPLFWPTRLRLCRIVHDAFPWSSQRAMPWKGRLLYRYGEDAMVRRYDWLFGTTEPVAAELRSVLGRPGIDWCGNAPGLDVDGAERKPAGLARDFVLAVGTVEPRKNYARLIELVDAAEEGGPAVVLAGRPGWGDDVAAVEGLAARHPTRFVWLRELPDEGLLWLYRRAACFLSLSRAEGFNMPLVESAMCARPVVCSDIPIHRGVAPPWARFVADDTTSAGLWQILRAAAAEPPSPPLVDDYRQRYSWRKVASRLLDLLAVPGSPAPAGRPL